MDTELAAKMNVIKKNPVLNYQRLGERVFADCGEDFDMRESRELVFKLGRDMDSEVRIIDEIVIEAVIANDYVAASAMNDDDNQPLQNWWWHLGKIRGKTYPVGLLPAYLQAVYKATSKNAL